MRSLLLSFGVLLLASTAQADEAADIATARTLAVDGLALADSGRCKEAIEKLARAEKLHHAPTTATRLGECEIEQGQILVGTERLQRVVHEPLPATAHPAFAAAVARARASLERNLPRLATIKIVLEGKECRNPSITIDGEAVSDAAIDVDRRIDPGAHRLSVRAPGCHSFETTFELGEGQTKQVNVVLNIDPMARARVASHDTDSGYSEATWVAFGAGAAGLVLGVAGGIVVASRTNTLSQTCVNRVCPPEARGDIGAAKTWATISTIGFVVAGVGAAAGVGLLIGAPKAGEKRTQAVIGLGTVALQGQF
jgi:hypothetical protein